MNKEFEKYFIGTLIIGIFISYLFLKTPNIIYKGNQSHEVIYNSKCYNNESKEISCKKNVDL
jgi:hypothetical protein